MKDDAIGPVAGTVAHQLGSNAALLSAHAAELAEGLTGGGPQREALAGVLSGAQGVRRVADDLLELARVERLPVEPEDVDPGAVAAGALARLQRDPAGAGAVVLEAGPLPAVHADPALLERVFVHLLRSAAAGYDRQGPAGVVVSGAEAGAGTVVLVVADDGAPLPADRLATLFDPGVPPRGRGPLVGAGVGLMLVRLLAGRLDGRVEARPRSGAPGVEIHLTLPGERR